MDLRTLPNLLLTVGCIGLLAACGSGEAATNREQDQPESVSEPAQVASEINVDELHDRVLVPEAQFVLLDVRTPEEIAQGHLLGATFIDYRSEDFKEQLAALDRNQQYYIYCASGGRSGRTQSVMEELGFTQITNVAGGITAWKAAGYPVTVP